MEPFTTFEKVVVISFFIGLFLVCRYVDNSNPCYVNGYNPGECNRYSH